MPALPTKRLLVYVTAGTLVLVVGAFGLLSLRGASSGQGVVLVDSARTGRGVDSGDGGAVEAGENAGNLGPTASSTTESPRIWVQIAGAVRRPGVYHLVAGTRVFQAVLEAGGATAEADQDAVAMAAELFDGCRVYMPSIGEMPAGTIVGPTASTTGLSGGSMSGMGSSGLVSLNTATATELDGLPGIGPALAGQIVAYRDACGPFTSIEQLLDVPGIGPAKLEQIRPLVRL